MQSNQPTAPINPCFQDVLVLIKGAGDLASGVAYRLKRAGFPLIMTELPAPLMVRRAVCFGEAVYQGQTTVEGITARRVDSPEAARQLAWSTEIPVLVAPEADIAARLSPQVLVDAIMAKRNTGTSIHDAALVIALGPGFTAGVDCHAVIETNRGHFLGRVIYRGQAEPDTGKPGPVRGHVADRVLRAPAAGHVDPRARIGDPIRRGQLIAVVGGAELRAPFDGVLRGLIHPAVQVAPGEKIGDLDPRGVPEHCWTISEKSLAVGGGVLEAILAGEVVRK
ncbi:MAG: EF2563 family selenium-dependent molybdenum hydroxylase system protein [Chloroflexi bacterium]|nr:MAG: EF2563 family selenium-dependent molybdenum hydroxylase system protein [Chloroflexota bacterium]